MATAAERFRSRFHVEAPPRAGQRPTPDERLRAALDLHAFNLLLAIDKVRAQMEGAAETTIIDEVNRRRLARSPMPRPIGRRLPRCDGEARSE